MNRPIVYFIVICLFIPFNSNSSIDLCDAPLFQTVECCCGEQEEIEVPGGDFEFSPFPAPGGWIDYTSSAGPWDVSTGSVSHHDDGHNNLGAGNPNPSTAHMDLNGASQGGICQTISGFTPGQECTIVFYYAIHNGISNGSASLQIDGGSALDIVWDATNVGSDIWLEANYTFLSTSSDMEVCFESLTSVPCCGMLVDDIQIFCCPPDEEDPVLNEEPEDEIYACMNEVPDPPDIGATDDCSDNLDVQYDEELNDSNPCSMIITREWEVVDECGNTSMHTQFIEIADAEAPIVLSSPEDLYLSCTDDIDDIVQSWIDNLGGADLFDNCDEIFISAIHDDIPIDTCSETFVQFIISDECGNFVESEAFIFMEDFSDPSFNILPSDLTVPCNGEQDSIINAWLLANGNSMVIDNCDFSVTNNFSGVYDSTQVINFMAIDNCGNTSSAPAMLIVSEDVDTFHFFDTTCDILQPPMVEIFIDVINGCDSLKIYHFELLPHDSVYIVDYTCDPLEVILDTIYGINNFGCDSISFIEMILLDTDTSSLVEYTCSPESVMIDTIIETNLAGCDSIIYHEIKLLQSDTNLIAEFTCDPALVILDTIIETNLAGCDSIIINEVRLLPSDTTILSEATCDVLALEPDTIILLNSDGCDSIILTTFYLTENDTVVNTLFSCDILEEEMTSMTIQGPICDSIIINHTIPLENHLIEIISSTCLFANVGIDTITETNTFGCDSMVITTIIYDPIAPIVSNVETCFESEIGSDTLFISTGACDSILITNVSLIAGNESFLVEKTCDLTLPQNDTLVLQNISGCDSIVVTEYFNDPIDFNIESEYNACEAIDNGIIEIINISGGTPPYLYSLNNGPFQSNPIFSGLNSGTYESLIMDNDGCMSVAQEIIFLEEQLLEITLPNELVLQSGQSDQILIDFSFEPDTFYWSHPEIMSCIQCLNPSVIYDQETTITLNAISPEGCIYEKSINLIKNDTRFYIPNIFSPNGDGFNDRFKIFHSDPNAIIKSMRIFNRWGNLLFEKTNFSANEDISWDGRYNNIDLTPDVFVYYIELETSTATPQIIVGDLTLIR